MLDDNAWKNVTSTSSFTQSNPTSGLPVKNKTEVKIIYDNTAIYISAMMYDNSCDSVCRQLGNRDEDLNADEFRIVFESIEHYFVKSIVLFRLSISKKKALNPFYHHKIIHKIPFSNIKICNFFYYKPVFEIEINCFIIAPIYG